MIRVAVVGTGRAGLLHTKIYAHLKGVQLACICDIDKKRAEEVASQFSARSFTDYRKLIERVDAVSIAVPTSLHYAIAKDFLRAGVHTLIEKPIATNLKEADELLELARKNRLILQVGHIERFNSAVIKVMGLLKKPVFIECHRLSPYPHRGTDVSVILDVMIHDIDIILSLVSSGITRIDAVGTSVLSSSTDIANARIQFKSGTTANLTSSRISDETMRKIRIFQKDAYFSLDYRAQEAVIYTKKGPSIVSRKIPIQKREPILDELKEFISCIAKKKEPTASAQQARDALAVALKIEERINC